MRKIHLFALMILAAAGILLGLIVLVLYSERPSSTYEDLTEEKAGSASDHETTIVANDNQAIPPHEVSEPLVSLDVLNTWNAVEIEDVDLSFVPKYKETVKGAVLVQLAQDLRRCQQGDSIAIEVPQSNSTYTAKIEKISTSLGTNTSFRGKLIQEDDQYSFLITVGQRNVFANFSTPEGSFELVGNAEYAWLMPSANIDQHVDYDSPDFYIPDDGYGEQQH